MVEVFFKIFGTILLLHNSNHWGQIIDTDCNHVITHHSPTELIWIVIIVQQQQVVIGTSVGPPVPPDDESGTGVTSGTGIEPPQETDDAITKLRLIFRLPSGKVSDVLQVIRYLLTKFEAIGMELALDNGEISERDYEDKIEEAFRQMGIDLERQ